MRIPRSRLSAALVALLLAPLARATDGVIEINAARAAAGGVTAGDSGGFPVEIFTRGNFRLTSDLIVPAGASAGIVVYAAGTQIDLNGFTISSTTTCTGSPPSCAPSGTGTGIDASAADAVVVRNGRVTGFGVYGVALFSGSSAEKLRVDANALGGIVTDTTSEVTRCIVRQNGGAGITVGADSRVAENIVSGNNGPGITAPLSALSERNAVNHNAGSSVAGVRARRFYATFTPVHANQALSACAAGFHMASLWELRSPSPLSYDNERAGNLSGDLGTGPPSNYVGWVRTGLPGSATDSRPGIANCANWTSGNSTDFGTAVRLDNTWVPSPPAAPLSTWPWVPVALQCTVSVSVWCIED